MDSFAFIIHPISPKQDISRKYPVLGRIVNEWMIDHISPYWPPVYVSEVEGVISESTGKQIKGWLLACGLTPKHFIELPESRVYRKIIETGRLAEKLGANILGLGAFTSVVGDAGLTVAQKLDIPVTTGDSYTVSVSLSAINRAASLMGVTMGESTAAVVGATGSIGKACARELSKSVSELYLISRNLDNLENTREELIASGANASIIVSTNINDLLKSRLILTVTSSIFAIINSEQLQPGTVVCDVSRPRDVSHKIIEYRDDVLVIDGGIVEVPGPVDFHFNFGLPPGHSYACMAETMALTLDGRFEDYSLGRNITHERVNEISNIANKHGFKLSGFNTYEQPITNEKIEQFKMFTRQSIEYL
jgi:predicted amino acid dehydrogenase